MRSKGRAWPSFVLNFMLIFTVTLALVVTVNGLIVTNNEGALQDALAHTNRYALERIRDIVDLLIAESERVAYFIAAEEDINALAYKDSFLFDRYEKIERLVRAHRSIELLTGTNTYIDSIYVYYANSGYVCASDIGTMEAVFFYDNSWLADAAVMGRSQSTRSEIRHPVYQRATRFGPPPPYYLTTYCGIRDLDQGLAQGLVIVNTDIHALGTLFSSSVDDESMLRLYITDAENRILYSEDAEEIGVALDTRYDIDLDEALGRQSLRLTIDGEPCMISAMTSRYNAFRFYTIHHMRSIVQESRTVRTYAFEVLIAGVLPLLLISLVLAYRFYRPLRDILSVLDAPTAWKARTRRGKRSAVADVCDRILFNISRNEALEHELTERMLSLHHAQEIALKSQLNPHFLNNTLDAINWKARQLTGGENDASEMITLLSDLLGASLGAPEKLVTLGHELETAAKYVRINQIRKPGRCEVAWHIDPQMEGFYVAPMILQPLLENAWQHGFRDASYAARVDVYCERAQGSLQVRVVDNGRGMPSEQLAAVRADLDGGNIARSRHIGLQNVHMRLRLMFGEGYGLSIDSMEGEGTCVRLVMPCIRGVEKVT